MTDLYLRDLAETQKNELICSWKREAEEARNKLSQGSSDVAELKRLAKKLDHYDVIFEAIRNDEDITVGKFLDTGKEHIA